MTRFLTIWIGQLLSLFGSGLTTFGLGVWAFQKSGNATEYTLIWFFYMLPNILVSPFAGVIADRWNRKTVMILADTAAGISTAVLLALLLTERLELWHIYLMTLVNATAQCLQEPAYFATMAALVPKERLGRTNGLTYTALAVREFLSPLAAGVLMLVIGLQGIIMIDIVTFLIAVGTLVLVRIPHHLSAEKRKRKMTMRQDIKEGWSYVRLRPGLLALLLFFAFLNIGINTHHILTTPLILSFAEQWLGVVLACGGVGLLLGSLVMSAWGGAAAGKRIRFMSICSIVISLAIIMAGSRPFVWIVAAALFFSYFFLALQNSHSSLIWQIKSPPELHGRVFALRRFVSSIPKPIHLLLLGPIADAMGPLFLPGGRLANTFGAQLVGGIGEGRGIAFLLVLVGVVTLIGTVLAYSYPPLHNLETDVADAMIDVPQPVSS